MNVKLSQFSHGGGCGCKISPGVLADILAQTPLPSLPKDLLVGRDTADDAAVYRISDEQAIVATTDFFTPIVDDPRDFGRIAAANALSDVYAMGGRPILALAVVGMPLDKLPVEAVREILEGGAEICAQAGVPIAGGHSIDIAEPIYGLVALGLVHPGRVKTNAGAKAGDALILGKPLGIGILSAALKKGMLGEDGYRDMLACTTQLNTPGAALAGLPGVHAVTDVTGFGLAGHLLELCRAANLAAEVQFDRLPVIPEAGRLVREGIATGASARNWASYGDQVVLPAAAEEWQQKLLTDPQTNGGLLVACAPDAVADVIGQFEGEGFTAVSIGRMKPGAAQVTVS